MGNNGSFNMIEREEPKFVQFTVGDIVAGVLTAVETAEIKGKRVARFILQDLESGNQCAFLGTAQINAKLRRTDLGHLVEVRCTGEDANVVKNGNRMKLFRVFVSDKAASSTDDLFITEDDLPDM